MLAYRFSRNFMQSSRLIRTQRYYETTLKTPKNFNVQIKPAVKHVFDAYQFDASHTLLNVEKKKLDESLSALPFLHLGHCKNILADVKKDPNHAGNEVVSLEKLLKITSFATYLPSDESYGKFVGELNSILVKNQIPKESLLYHKLFFQLIQSSYNSHTLEKFISQWYILVKNGYVISARDFDSIQFQLLTANNTVTRNSFLTNLFRGAPLLSSNSSHILASELISSPVPIPLYKQSEILEQKLHDYAQIHVRSGAPRSSSLTDLEKQFSLFLESILTYESEKMVKNEMQEKLVEITKSFPVGSTENAPVTVSNSSQHFKVITNYFLTLSETSAPKVSVIDSLGILHSFLGKYADLIATNFPNQQLPSQLITDLISVDAHSPKHKPHYVNEVLCLSQEHLLHELKSKGTISQIDLLTTMYYDNIVNQIMMNRLAWRYPSKAANRSARKYYEIQILSDLEHFRCKMWKLKAQNPNLASSVSAYNQLQLCLMEASRRNILSFWGGKVNSLKRIQIYVSSAIENHYVKIQNSYRPITSPEVKAEDNINTTLAGSEIPPPVATDSPAVATEKTKTVTTTTSRPVPVPSAAEIHYTSTALNILTHYYLSIPKIPNKNINSFFFHRTVKFANKLNAKGIAIHPLTYALINSDAPKQIYRTLFYKKISSPEIKTIRTTTAAGTSSLRKIKTPARWSKKPLPYLHRSRPVITYSIQRFIQARDKWKIQPMKFIEESAILKNFIPTFKLPNQIHSIEEFFDLKLNHLETLCFSQTLQSQILFHYRTDNYLQSIDSFKKLMHFANLTATKGSFLGNNPSNNMADIISTLPSAPYFDPLIFKAGILSFSHLLDHVNRLKKSPNLKDQNILNSLQAILYDPKPLLDWIMKNFVLYSDPACLMQPIPLTSAFLPESPFKKTELPSEYQKIRALRAKLKYLTEEEKASGAYTNIQLRKVLLSREIIGTKLADPYRSESLELNISDNTILHSSMRLFTKCLHRLNAKNAAIQAQSPATQKLASINDRLMKKSHEFLSFWLQYNQSYQNFKHNYPDFTYTQANSFHHLLGSTLYDHLQSENEKSKINNQHHSLELFCEHLFRPKYAALIAEQMKTYLFAHEPMIGLQFLTNLHNTYYNPQFSPIPFPSDLPAMTSSSSSSATTTTMTSAEGKSSKQPNPFWSSKFYGEYGLKLHELPEFMKPTSSSTSEKSLMKQVFNAFRKEKTNQNKNNALMERNEKYMKDIWGILFEPILHYMLFYDQLNTPEASQRISNVKSLLLKYLTNWNYSLTDYHVNHLLQAHIMSESRKKRYKEGLDLCMNYYNQFHIKPNRKNLRRLLATAAYYRDHHEIDRILQFANSIYSDFTYYLKRHPIRKAALYPNLPLSYKQKILHKKLQFFKRIRYHRIAKGLPAMIYKKKMIIPGQRIPKKFFTSEERKRIKRQSRRRSPEEYEKWKEIKKTLNKYSKINMKKQLALKKEQEKRDALIRAEKEKQAAAKAILERKRKITLEDEKKRADSLIAKLFGK